MYDLVGSLRSARRQMDAPAAPPPIAAARVVIGRVRKLLAEYLPGMGWDRRWREALAAPLPAPLEPERLFVLGWLHWLEGDPTAAEGLLAEADSRCAGADEGPAAPDMPALEPGLLAARA